MFSCSARMTCPRHCGSETTRRKLLRRHTSVRQGAAPVPAPCYDHAPCLQSWINEDGPGASYFVTGCQPSAHAVGQRHRRVQPRRRETLQPTAGRRMVGLCSVPGVFCLPALCSVRSLRESGFWQCGIALLDFEDLRTTNADPVNVVRAGYGQELLEEACLANFREILIARGAARLQLDRLLSPL